MHSFGWCTVNLDCNTASQPPDSNGTGFRDLHDNSSTPNSTNVSCSGLPFCVLVLTTTIGPSNVRIYDLVLVCGNVVFLLVLLIRMAPTVKKLIHSFLLFKILYSMVFVIPIMSLIHGIINMVLGYKDVSAKVTQVLVRGSILMTEISVVIFGLFFRAYADQLIKLCFTVFTILLVTTMFTVAEGISELLKVDKRLVCHQLNLFTHGGMLFLFTTSVVFATVYFLIYLMYMLGLSKRWDFPSKKSFYRYTLVLSVVNTLQAVGSMLWYTGRERRGTGSAGICITTITNFVYLTTFAPVVYWIFLKNYFRMNKLSAPSQNSAEAINTSTDEGISSKRRSISVRFSKPTLIRKQRSSYFEEQTMLEGDLDSSVSSYGSFTKDEEVFS